MRLLVLALILVAAAAAQSYHPPASQPPAAAPELGGNLPALPIGPNDLIAVSVYDAPELSRTIRIGTDGMIRLPMLKQLIKAEGLFPADLETAIAQALRDEQIPGRPLRHRHHRRISQPAHQRLRRGQDAPCIPGRRPHLAAGSHRPRAGPRENAGPEVLVSRSQPGPDGANLWCSPAASPCAPSLTPPIPALNLTLNGGEEIRVPEVSRIYVVGNVKKPGSFPVQDGADTTSSKWSRSPKASCRSPARKRLHLSPRTRRHQERNPRPARQDHDPQSSRTSRSKAKTSSTSPIIKAAAPPSPFSKRFSS